MEEKREEKPPFEEPSHCLLCGVVGPAPPSRPMILPRWVPASLVLRHDFGAGRDKQGGGAVPYLFADRENLQIQGAAPLTPYRSVTMCLSLALDGWLEAEEILSDSVHKE